MLSVIFRRLCCVLAGLLLGLSLAPAAVADAPPKGVFTPVSDVTSRISLKGTWQFFPNAPGDFYERLDENIADQLQIPVPSEIESTYPDLVRGELETTGFSRDIRLPSEWAGQRIKLRFRSVEGVAMVYVNGTFVGRFVGPWIPFEFDITEAARAGEVNTIAVHISSNETVRLSHRGFLGIAFEPELIAVPSVYVSSFHINTDLDEAYQDAELQLRWVVTNRSDVRREAGEIVVSLEDPEDEDVTLTQTTVGVPALDAGATAEVVLNQTIASPAKWTPETPSLYTLTTELVGDGPVPSSTRNRVGFREIEITDDHVLLNGEVLKILSVGYHHVPSYKNLHAVTREELRKDMELMKYANFVMVRAAPYPDLIEICDEIGLMTAVENTINAVGMTWMPWSKELGETQVFYDEYMQMLAQLVEVFRNHTSVVAWNLANESLFTMKPFVDGGFMVQELDPTRIVWAEAHESEEMGKNLPQTNVDNYHYPNFVNKGMPDKRPIFYGEWAHVHEYAKGDFNTDPAVLDQWIHDYEAHIDYMHAFDKVLGGHLFYGVSFTIRMKNHWGGLQRDWGILDRYRRAKPEFWNVKKANSPLRLQSAGLSEDRETASFTLKNFSRFMPTTGYTWKATLNGQPMEVPVPEIAPFEVGTVELALHRAMQPGDELLLDVISAEGRLVDRYAVRGPLEIEAPAAFAVLEHREVDGRLVVRSGDRFWQIDLATGLFISGSVDGIDVLESGPYLTATRQHTRGSTLATNWTLEEVTYEVGDEGLVVRVRGRYDEAEGGYTYTFTRDGQLRVGYDFNWLVKNGPATRPWHTPPDSQEMREVGISFALSPRMNRLRWVREGYWTWYPEDHIARHTGEATAEHVRLPGHSGPYARLPWHLEANEFGTRDFRSTKTHVRRSGLHHEKDGAALTFYSDGSQHTRAYLHPERQQIFFTQVDRYAGGHERFLQGSRIYGTPRIVLDEGVRVHGEGLWVLE
ncbi:glycoside hydrolase family 2 TIM barrel-domain containing protein [Mucisphaera sp.]|uniref:glycoside hydrolase family 2 TIM barrel-domain containing protein n=1 Tax=Mucisphaera sp. TaxID=2913024 RepID=UPI003D0DDBA3